MGKDLEKSIELVNKVRTILRRRNALTTNKATMLAISGGQDSACLIAMAAQMRKQWRCSFGVISCNHLWQRDSFHGLVHVCRLAFLIRQPIYFVVAPCNILNEAAARGWRYNSMQRIGGLYHFSAICTGHTASDRVETILFNFVRGSGIRGLSSLGWTRFFVTSYPNWYHCANFEGTAPGQSTAFFCPKLRRRPTLAEKQLGFKSALLFSRSFQEGRAPPLASLCLGCIPLGCTQSPPTARPCCACGGCCIACDARALPVPHKAMQHPSKRCTGCVAPATSLRTPACIAKRCWSSADNRLVG